MATEIQATEIDYPTSDGKPMAETDWHYNLLVDVRERLAARYADRLDVYVSGNLMVYYEPGKPNVFLSPDGFVVFGVPAGDRPLYKTWEEGRYPDIVFEFTSKSTRKEDLGKKFKVYQDVWQVKEYFLFDPLGEYLRPSFQGYRLANGQFVEMKSVKGLFTSQVLGITLIPDGRRLLLREVASGAELLTEDEQRAVAAEQQAARAEQQAARAEQQAARAEQQAARAEHRADTAEAEAASLKAELAALRKQKPSA